VSKPQSLPLNGSSCLRFLATVLPLVVLVLVGILSLTQTKVAGDFGIASDQVHYDMAVADTIRNFKAYGVNPRIAASAEQHMLWQVAVAGVGLFVGNITKAAQIASLLFGLLLVWQSVRVARLLFPFAPFQLTAGIAVAGSLFVQTQLVSAGPGLAAATLLLAGIATYLKGLDAKGETAVLHARSAMFIGLAAMIRPELAFAWLGLVVHAMLRSFEQKSRFSPVHVVLQAGVGLAIIAIAFWPMVNQNKKAMDVAWPIEMDATALHLGSEVALTPVDRLASGVYRVLDGLPFTQGLAGIVLLVIFVLGLLFVVMNLSRRPQAKNSLALLFASIGVMVGTFVLGNAFGGTSGLAVAGLSPVLILFAVFGFILFGLGLSKRENGSASSGSILLWGVAPMFIVISGVIQTSIQLKEHRKTTAMVNQAQGAWSVWSKDHSNLGQLRIATDRPGWFGHRTDHSVELALGSNASRNALASLDMDSGKVDMSSFRKAMRLHRPDALVLFSQGAAEFASQIERAPIASRRKMVSLEGKNAPQVVLFDWR